MILSYQELEEIAAATMKDFNAFFFGKRKEAQIAMPSATPIDQFASQYLNLKVSYTRLSSDGTLCGLTAFEDTEYICNINGITKTIPIKRNQILIDSSFIEPNHIRKLCGKRRFTLAHECAHQILYYIRLVTLNKMVFKHIQNVLSYIQQFESVFVKKEMEKANAERAISIEKAKVDIITLKRRNEDIDTLFKRIYEDMVAGRISAERFDRLSSDYEEEQKQVKATIAQLADLIESGEEEQNDLNRFLQNVRRYTDPQELSGEILNDLVDKIVVHAPDKSSGHRKQKIEIFYKVVGIIDIPDVECIAEHGALGVPKPRKHAV